MKSEGAVFGDVTELEAKFPMTRNTTDANKDSDDHKYHGRPLPEKKNNRADDLKGAAVPPSQAGSKKKKTDLMQVIADKGGTLKEVTEIGIRRGMTRDAAIEKARKMMGKKHKTTFVRFVQGGAPK